MQLHFENNTVLEKNPGSDSDRGVNFNSAVSRGESFNKSATPSSDLPGLPNLQLGVDSAQHYTKDAVKAFQHGGKEEALTDLEYAVAALGEHAHDVDPVTEIWLPENLKGSDADKRGQMLDDAIDAVGILRDNASGAAPEGNGGPDKVPDGGRMQNEEDDQPPARDGERNDSRDEDHNDSHEDY